MSFSIKTTAIGVGLTAGSLLMIHNKFESDGEQRQATYETLINCANDLGQTGCLEAVEVYSEDIEQEITIQDNQAIYTYNKEDIVGKAEEVLADDEDGFQYFIYPATVLCGVVLTAGFQNRNMRRALAFQFD